MSFEKISYTFCLTLGPVKVERGAFLFFSKVCYNVIKNSRQVVNMVKVRKIPVVVDAEQISEVQYIETLEGTMKASAGDWVITGVDGERYPVKPDIFAKTYEIL